MKYYIRLVKHTEYYVEVNAENEEEAQEIALDLAESGKTEDFSCEDEDWEVLDCEELD